MQDQDLKPRLDELYSKCDFTAAALRDPIEFPRRYAQSRDKEVAGFVASALAYGKVSLFKPVIEQILLAMGQSPYGFLMEFQPQRHGRLLRGVKYRFNSNEDILALLHMLGIVLRAHGGLLGLFMSCYSEDDPDIGRGLDGMISYMLDLDTTPVYGRNTKPPGLRQLLPRPSGGSACKRLNLFLRWMVRDRDVDLGLWRGISPAKLVIPLDTHVARVSRCLGLTKRRGADWRTAVQITESLKKYDPNDPLKYDFTLCHLGISGLCRADGKACGACALSGQGGQGGLGRV